MSSSFELEALRLKWNQYFFYSWFIRNSHFSARHLRGLGKYASTKTNVDECTPPRTLVACDKTISHKCPYQLAFCSVWEYQKWRNVCRFEWCQCAGLLEEVRQTLMTSVDVDFFFSFPIMYYLLLTNRICYIHCDANRWKMFFALLILSNIRNQTYSKLRVRNVD